MKEQNKPIDEETDFHGPDRRAEADRRRRDEANGKTSERRNAMDRRKGPGRRRSEIRRVAEEGQHSGELMAFIHAVDEYKRTNNCPFPTWSQVFEIIHYLGYRKVAAQADHIDNPTDADVLSEIPCCDNALAAT